LIVATVASPAYFIPKLLSDPSFARPWQFLPPAGDTIRPYRSDSEGGEVPAEPPNRRPVGHEKC